MAGHRDFTVTIHDPERAVAFQRALGTTRVYVKAPFPERVNLPGRPRAWAFIVDLEQYTEDQIGSLADEIAAKWGLLKGEVLNDIYRDGIPILASSCSVVVANPQRWF